MASFKVPCPSCESLVLIKNPNLVGTKVECPKCKYRFKVEEPKGDATGEEPKKKDDGKDKKKGKQPPNKKVLAGVVIGVVAVAVLAGVGYMILGGGGKGKPVVSPNPTPYAGTPNTGDNENKSDEEKEKEAKEKEKKKDSGKGERIPAGVKAITNLMHPDTVGVFRFDLGRIGDSALGPQLFDVNTAKLFHKSMGFDIGEVTNCFYCAVGADRSPFVVVQVRSARKVEETEKKMGLYRAHAAVGNRSLYKVESNPFLTAVGSTFTLQSLLANYLQPAVPPKAAAKAEDKPFGICVYDTQTILIGDLGLLEKYLQELGDDGFPLPRGVSATPKDGSPDLSQVAVYKALDPELKRAMLAMEGLDAPPALAVWAEKFDAKRFDPKQLKDAHKPIADAISPLVNPPPSRILHYGVRLSDLDPKRLHVIAQLFVAPTDQEPILKSLSPKLRDGTLIASLLLSPSPLHDDTPIEYRDLTGITADPGTVPGGVPGGGEGGQPVGPRSSGGGSGPGPGGLQVPRGGEGGLAVPQGPALPEGGQPMPTQPAGHSYVELRTHEDMVTVTASIQWKDAVFNQIVFPRLKAQTDTLKGQLEVQSGSFDPHVLSKVPVEAAKVPVPMKREDFNAFPRGTIPRKSDGQFPVLAPPEARLSFFVNLLPYLGRDPMVRSRDAAWYSSTNSAAAEQWVPELLVPYYPASSWRVESSLAPGRTFGGTNYVGIAGRGADAARLNPANPSDQKLMGMTGYDWNSTPAEVKDGLSNTIYIMQVKPGIGRPWIAGGGATLMGMDDRSGHPMDDFASHHPGQSKPGAYAVMGDGSVRYVPSDIKKEVVLGMATRAGEEKSLPGEDAPLVPPPAPPMVPGDMPVEKKAMGQ